MSNTDKHGFNLLELMLATAMIVLMAGIIVPVAGNLYNRNNLDLATKQVVQNLRRAQTLAEASTDDSDWGVYLEGYDSVVFKGSNYASRDINYDEKEELPGKAATTGLTEIGFYKATGLPKAMGTTTITIDNDTKNIIINAKGTINY